MKKAEFICTTLLIEKSPQALPLGAACIVSAVNHSELTKDICHAKLIDFNMEESANIAESIYNSFSPDTEIKIAGFSVFVWNRVILEKVAAELKQKNVICIAGGPEITAHPEAFTSSFDYTVAGEGEQKVPKIIRNIVIPSEHSVTTDEHPVIPSEHPVIPSKAVGTSSINSNLPPENYTSPYLDGTLDPAKYGGALWELARGCPFKCSYCYESKGENKVRQFPMERIEKELDLFAAKKVPQVFVLDPTYNANKQRALDLLKLIAKKTPDTFYYFEARAEFIDRQLAHAFTKIPCALQIGLQTSDENVARLVHRPFNRKQFAKNISILNEEGVTFGLDVIYGLPSDSLRGYKDSIDFAISLYPNNLELFCLSVLPGTDLFDRADELKLTYQSEPPYHIIHTDKFSEEDIKRAGNIAKACSYFYNDGRAVPWFNTICHAAHLKPSQFFEQFYQFAQADCNTTSTKCDHKQIEQKQIEFVKHLFTQKNLGRLITAACDIISFNGAYSRKTDTGKSEKITLHYPAEYIDSEYALDLDFFVKNVRQGKFTYTI